ncbi:hypothetical protein TSAR_000302 [Trichomalopsis sarcophagae]|uniref:Uncharacterized protein n=1 Tax=Trichomalopsis sarcophagae TaxID=543379 RepID=A0A232F1G9_9HYME|nr:hypothetical protein TSAR_000302 [Trichomalopsis sarcophagae]
MLQTIPTPQVQEDEQPLNRSVMLIPGDIGEVTIGSISDEIIVESEVTEGRLDKLLNPQNNTYYNETSDSKIRNKNSSIQPSAQFSTDVKSISNCNEAIKHNQPPSSKSNLALKVNTAGKAQKRRRSEVDEDSELEELLEDENITLQDISTVLNEVRTLVVETRAMREKEDILSFNELCRQHNLNLPLEELNEFLDFDNQIQSKGDLYKSLKKYFISNIATCDTVKAQVTNI